MNILITGGAGFIGLHLVKFHLKQGDTVFILDNLSKSNIADDVEYKNVISNSNVHFFPIDLSTNVF